MAGGPSVQELRHTQRQLVGELLVSESTVSESPSCNNGLFLSIEHYTWSICAPNAWTSLARMHYSNFVAGPKPGG